MLWTFKQNEASEVAIVMLEELITRKKKWDNYDKLKSRWAFTGLSLIAMVVCYFFYFYASRQPSSVLQLIGGDSSFIFLSLAVAFAFFQVKYYYLKSEKAEKEFDALREELIERSTELWYTEEQWNNRKQVYDKMNKDYGINLFFK